MVDSQCIMPSLPDLCECFHTKLVTTSELARLPGAIHLPVSSPALAASAARKILKLARANRKNRSAGAEFAFRTRPAVAKPAAVGFSEDNIGLERMATDLKKGTLKGVLAAVGCVNPRHDAAGWMEAFRDLGRDHAILTTGCMAFELGAHGLLDGKRFFHLGSCVNNARVAAVFRRLAALSGKKISEMPFLASCPMPITEKSVSIGLFFSTLGCRVHFGEPFPINPGTGAARTLLRLLKDEYGSEAIFEASPAALAGKLRQAGFSAAKTEADDFLWLG